MTVEHAMIAQAKLRMTPGMAQKILQEEACKGCLPDLAPVPVHLEPPFWDFRRDSDIFTPGGRPWYVPAQVPDEADIARFTVWVTPELVCDWLRAERLLKQLQRCVHPLAFEIAGNESHIEFLFLCNNNEATILHAAFLGEFPDCTLTRTTDPVLGQVSIARWDKAAFREFYPPPPYSHLFTRPGELKDSPLTPFLNIMARLPEPILGVYQALFVPTRPEHNWTGHVRRLLDLEYNQATYGAMQSYQRYAQQMPSADLRGMALDADQKSHNDKPLYAAVARVVAFSDHLRDSEEYLRALDVPIGLFQHGGHALGYVTQESFRQILSPEGLRTMFLRGLSYRPGFILNSEELAGFVNLPPVPEPYKRVPVAVLDGLGSTSRNLESGTLIGYRKHADARIPIYVPELFRRNGGHLIGKPGMGKSWLIEGMLLQDIERNEGAAVIDPHGDLVERILARLPEHCLDRVIVFDPGEEDWTFLWNILASFGGKDPSRVADEITAAMHDISDGWGDRLGNIMRLTIAGVLCLEGSTLADVETLLRNTRAQREQLAKRIVATTDNPTVRRFWEANLKGYRDVDVQPALNKLGKLMAPRGVGRMLSQPISRIDFRKIMDEGGIFLANLANIGETARNVLGTVVMSSIYLAAISRNDLPEDLRKPFNVYADEGHRFIAASMTDFIQQTRKHRVNLTLAHQFLSQWKAEDIDALGTTGFTVIFGVLHKDAERLLKMHGAEIAPQDLRLFQPGDALARIGSEWVRITTAERPATVNDEIRNRAIALSREKYYCRATDTSCDSALFGHKKVRPAAVAPVEDEETDYVFDTL